MSTIKQQRGVGLIEVMIAVLVLVVGLTALMKFQGEMLKSGSFSQQRVEALTLAQRKMDDLRSFTETSTVFNNSPTPSAVPWSSTLTTCTTNCTAMSFLYIDDNTGGKIAASTSDTNYNHTGATAAYSLRWTVGDADAGTTTITSTTTSKNVTVTVRWVDGAGTVQSVNVGGLIAALDPAGQATSVTNSSSYSAGKPVPYIFTGGTKLGNKNTTDTQTIIDTGAALNQWWETAEDGSTKQVGLARCECTQGTSTADGRMVSFNDGSGFAIGDFVTKRIGRPDLVYGTQSWETTEVVCFTCCRDHHDTTSSTYVYDAYRKYYGGTGNPGWGSASDSDHSHYFWSESMNATAENNVAYTPAPSYPTIAYAVADDVSDAYHEACRLERANGSWTVMQDHYPLAINIFPSTFSYADYCSNSTYKTKTTCEAASATWNANYSNYVKTAIKKAIMQIGTTLPITNNLHAPPSIVTDGDVATARAAVGFPTSVSSASATLPARAISLPYMPPWQIAILRCKIDGTLIATTEGAISYTDSEGDSVLVNCANFPVDANWLNYVGYTDQFVHQTAVWRVMNSTGTVALTDAWNTAESANTINATTYSFDTQNLGVVTLGGSSAANIVAYARLGNTTFARGNYFVDGHDGLAPINSNYLCVANGASCPSTPTPTNTPTAIPTSGPTSTPGPTRTVSGTLTKDAGANTAADGATVTGTGGASCTSTVPAGTYSCTLTAGTGNIVVGSYSSNPASKDNSVCPLSIAGATGIVAGNERKFFTQCVNHFGGIINR